MCMSGCEDSCGNLNAKASCPNRCYEGCECTDPDHVKEGDQCIHRKSCGCSESGMYYPVSWNKSRFNFFNQLLFERTIIYKILCFKINPREIVYNRKDSCLLIFEVFFIFARWNMHLPGMVAPVIVNVCPVESYVACL